MIDPKSLIIQHSDLDFLFKIRFDLTMNLADSWIYLHTDRDVKGIEVCNEFGGPITGKQLELAQSIIDKHLDEYTKPVSKKPLIFV